MEPFAVAADQFLQMPGDGFAFPVQVGREVDIVRAIRELAQFGNHLLLAGQRFVFRLPTVVRVYSHASNELGAGASGLVFGPFLRREFARFRRFARTFGGIGALAAHGKIANVSDARLDDIVPAEIAIDGPGFGRRLDDDQRLRHRIPTPQWWRSFCGRRAPSRQDTDCGPYRYCLECLSTMRPPPHSDSNPWWARTSLQASGRSSAHSSVLHDNSKDVCSEASARSRSAISPTSSAASRPRVFSSQYQPAARPVTSIARQ